MFHQTFHRKEEERPFSINALIGCRDHRRHHAPLPNNGQGKATLTKSTVVCVIFHPGNRSIVFILKTTKRLFGRSAWQQSCHRRPKRKPRPKLDISLLVIHAIAELLAGVVFLLGGLVDHSDKCVPFYTEHVVFFASL